MTEHDIIIHAADAFERADALKQQQRKLDDELRGLCREYDKATLRWGWKPDMMRRVVSERFGKIRP